MIGEDFELEVIRSVLAADGDPDAERRARTRGELVTLISHELSMVEDSRQTDIRGRRRLAVRPWGIGALSVVAAAVAVVVLVLGHGGAAQPTSAVAALLDRAANSTSLVSPAHLGPGQVWYVEQEWVDGPPEAPCKTDCYETRLLRWWVGPRRYSMHTYVLSRSTTQPTISHVPPNVPMRAARFSARWSGVGGGYDRIYHYKLMLNASTSPSSLRSLLLHPPGVRGVPRTPPRWEREQLIFASINTILLEPRVPARMLSAIYRLLATMPGTTLKGRVTDTLGRHVIEVDCQSPMAPNVHETRERFALLFDPETYTLLDTLRITANKKSPSYSYMANVSHGLVHQIGGLPASQTNP